MKSIYTTRHCDRNPRHFTNQADLPLSSAAVDANRLGDKKIAYGNPKLINALNRSKPSNQSDTRPPSQVDYVCICRNAHHIY
jgi:hypothetical protein